MSVLSQTPSIAIHPSPAVPGVKPAALAGCPEAQAADRARWERPERGYYRELTRLIRMHVEPGARVLQVGCGMGTLLASAQPARGLGLDANPAVVREAQQRHPHLEFVTADPSRFSLDETFDYVIVGDALSVMDDVQACFERIRRVCRPDTRIIVSYISPWWNPLLRLLSAVGLRRRTAALNWLGTPDVRNLLHLAGFKVIRHNHEMVLPANVPGLTQLCNRLLARIWPTQYLSLVHMLIARADGELAPPATLSCSVVVPTKDERGNVEAVVQRTPQMGAHTEIIFVDGRSADGTADEIQRVIAAYPERDIKFVCQGDGRGKGDAVRRGFAAATGDVLMILDADLTVPPEELPKFFHSLARGHGEFINGTRLVYPMESQAMRALNKFANRLFSVLFTWLLDQRFRDTLCGTKVMHRDSYERIARQRAYFGGLDPFGDFDFIFGAAKANLEILEIPVHYKARTYGDTSIARFRDGLKLFQMCAVALWKLKLR